MDMITLLYAVLILATTPLPALYLNYLTHDEKHLTDFYFPAILTLLGVASFILFFIDFVSVFVCVYMFFVFVIWFSVSKKKPKKRGR